MNNVDHGHHAQVQFFDQEDVDDGTLLKSSAPAEKTPPKNLNNRSPSSSKCPKSSTNNNNCYTRREKFFIILLISVFILFLTLLVLFLKKELFSAEEVCMTASCIKLAAGLLSSLDESVNPCTDFYQFVCGNWIRSHPIPDDRPTVSNFEQPTIDLEYALKQLLDNVSHTRHSSIDSARTFYRSCENETLIVKTWRLAFEESKNLLGGWPVLDKTWRPSLGGGGGETSTKDSSNQNGTSGYMKPSRQRRLRQQRQQQIIRNLFKTAMVAATPDDVLPPAGQNTISKLYGLLSLNFTQDSLFKFSVGADDKNSSSHIFQVDQGALTLLSRDFYLSPEGYEERDAYLDLMTECVLLLGADSRTARAEMAAVMQFETDLANISRDETRQDVESTYLKVTFLALRMEIPKFNWRIFMEALYPRHKFPHETPVVLYCADFLDDLSHLLVRYEERIITNYLMWRWFYSEVLPQLPDPYFMVHFKFLRALQNMKVPQLRWHSCIRQVNQHMLHATGALYVRQYFNPSAKQRILKISEVWHYEEIEQYDPENNPDGGLFSQYVNTFMRMKLAAEMIEMIKEAFHESLKENQWLTPETKKVASEKIDAMLLKTGYPDFVLNFTEVDLYYKEFKHFGPDFFRTKFLFGYLNNRLHYDRIFEDVDKNRWTSGSAVVNAFYSPNTNEIMFPAGILQPVFYSESYPWSMNFGGIGVVIGHEITHGFDDKGRQYDKDGNVREWWDNETVVMFEKKAQCIEDQYSKYEVDQVKLKVNGKNTKGENIADNGGLKQAFKAYLKWSKQNKAEQLLPGINYSHKQLFFINYAQIWCGSMNDKEFIRKIKTSVHSPGMIRVKGPLQNMQDFSDAFRCKLGSPMNPFPKCEIW